MTDNVVKNYTDLFRLKKIADGTIYEVEGTGKHYIKRGHNWDEMTKANIKGAANGPTISLYELNQSSIMQFPPMDEEKINSYIKTLNEWHSLTSDKHFMLLSNKFNYYTIFELTDYLVNPKPTSFGEVVTDLLKSFDKVYSISPFDEEKSGWEIWATLSKENKAPEVFYLFPYDKGVINYG